MSPGGQVGISAREAEVLVAVGAHRSNAQIANALHISVRTVESHVSSLLRKYGVADRRALADLAELGRPAPGGFVGLPSSRTTFVGRERDREAVTAAMGTSRLVTLLGPGGMGKTRLAATVAEATAEGFPAGGAFVDLVPTRDGFVTRTVAGVLGVSERPPQPLELGVVERLAAGRSLLVLDNCEHLLDEVGDLVERILSAGPDTTVVATSRERLGVPGERTVLVPPIVGSDAEQLFLDRARSVDPGFDADHLAIAELCARLDGMPLAIELAAARAGSLGLDGLRAALDDRMRLLAGGRGSDPRHRSLSAVIGWSHAQLDPDERMLFRRLAVFVGGFDLDAAWATSPELGRGQVADLVGRLADKSLADRRPGASRWRLLETIRAFAADELTASDEQAEIYDRHRRWAVRTAAALESALEAAFESTLETASAAMSAPEVSTDGDSADRGMESDWRVDFDEAAADLRAALASTAAEPDSAAHRLARSLGHLTFARRDFVEATAHYRSAADRATDGATAAGDLRSAADAALAFSDGPAAYQFLLDAANRAAADPNVRATMLARAVIVVNRYPAGAMFQIPVEHTAALLGEAVAAADPDDPRVSALIAAARSWDHGDRRIRADPGLAQTAVDAARLTGDPVLTAGALDALGTAAGNAGRLREARTYAEERVRLVDRLPRHEPYSAAEVIDAYHVASRDAISTGDLPAALDLARRANADAPDGDHPYISLPRLIRVLALIGQFDEAAVHADALWERWRRAGSPPMEWMASAVSAAALAHGLRGDGEFDQWRDRALEIARVDDAATSPILGPSAAFAEARVAVHTGRLDPAVVGRAFAPFLEHWWAPYAHAAGAELAVVAGLPDAPARLAAAGPAAAENDWAAACVIRATARLHGDPAGLVEAVDRWERIGARFERACTLLLLPDRAREGEVELETLGSPLPA